MKAIAIIDSEKDLGQVLKVQRKACNVTQKQLADFCNLSNNGISLIELAQKSPQLSTVLRLFKMLGLKLVVCADDDEVLKDVRRNQAIMEQGETEAEKNARLDSYYKRLYGISLVEYNAMLEKQGGRCVLCDRLQSEISTRFVIDHNHDTGAVRGLLCTGCNSALGHYERCVKRTSASKLREYLDGR